MWWISLWTSGLFNERHWFLSEWWKASHPCAYSTHLYSSCFEWLGVISLSFLFGQYPPLFTFKSSTKPVLFPSPVCWTVNSWRLVLSLVLVSLFISSSYKFQIVLICSQHHFERKENMSNAVLFRVTASLPEYILKHTHTHTQSVHNQYYPLFIRPWADGIILQSGRNSEREAGNVLGARRSEWELSLRTERESRCGWSSL